MSTSRANGWYRIPGDPELKGKRWTVSGATKFFWAYYENGKPVACKSRYVNYSGKDPDFGYPGGSSRAKLISHEKLWGMSVAKLMDQQEAPIVNLDQELELAKKKFLGQRVKSNLERGASTWIVSKVMRGGWSQRLMVESDRGRNYYTNNISIIEEEARMSTKDKYQLNPIHRSNGWYHLKPDRIGDGFRLWISLERDEEFRYHHAVYIKDGRPTATLASSVRFSDNELQARSAPTSTSADDNWIQHCERVWGEDIINILEPDEVDLKLEQERERLIGKKVSYSYSHGATGKAEIVKITRGDYGQVNTLYAWTSGKTWINPADCAVIEESKVEVESQLTDGWHMLPGDGRGDTTELQHKYRWANKSSEKVCIWAYVEAGKTRGIWIQAGSTRAPENEKDRITTVWEKQLVEFEKSFAVKADDELARKHTAPITISKKPEGWIKVPGDGEVDSPDERFAIGGFQKYYWWAYYQDGKPIDLQATAKKDDRPGIAFGKSFANYEAFWGKTIIELVEGKVPEPKIDTVKTLKSLDGWYLVPSIENYPAGKSMPNWAKGTEIWAYVSDGKTDALWIESPPSLRPISTDKPIEAHRSQLRDFEASIGQKIDQILIKQQVVKPAIATDFLAQTVSTITDGWYKIPGDNNPLSPKTRIGMNGDATRYYFWAYYKNGAVIEVNGWQREELRPTYIPQNISTTMHGFEEAWCLSVAELMKGAVMEKLPEATTAVAPLTWLKNGWYEIPGDGIGENPQMRESPDSGRFYYWGYVENGVVIAAYGSHERDSINAMDRPSFSKKARLAQLESAWQVKVQDLLVPTRPKLPLKHGWYKLPGNKRYAHLRGKYANFAVLIQDGMPIAALSRNSAAEIDAMILHNEPAYDSYKHYLKKSEEVWNESFYEIFAKHLHVAYVPESRPPNPPRLNVDDGRYILPGGARTSPITEKSAYYIVNIKQGLPEGLVSFYDEKNQYTELGIEDFGKATKDYQANSEKLWGITVFTIIEQELKKVGKLTTRTSAEAAALKGKAEIKEEKKAALPKLEPVKVTLPKLEPVAQVVKVVETASETKLQQPKEDMKLGKTAGMAFGTIMGLAALNRLAQRLGRKKPAVQEKVLHVEEVEEAKK